MTKEIKVAVAIFIIGVVGVGIYWFYPAKSEKEKYSLKEEEVILPKFDREFYRKIPEVREYLNDVKRALGKGEVLKVDS